MSHDPRHEEWMVERMSGGGLSGQHRAELDNCAHCRALEADLKAITRSLDRAAAHEHAVVGRLARGEDPESMARSAARRSRRLAIPWSLAAAALIFLGVFAWTQYSNRDVSPKNDGPGPILGSGPIRDLAPSGVVAAFDAFTFVAQRPPGGEFRVRVYDPASGALVVESPPLEIPRWTPNPTELEQIPGVFSWKAIVFDSSGIEMAASSAEVRRQGR